MGDELLTTREAADLLGVSLRTLVRIGKPALVQPGRSGGDYQMSLYGREAILAIKEQRDNDLCPVCEQYPTKPGRSRTCGNPRCVKQWTQQRAARHHQERKQRAAEQRQSEPPVRPQPSGTIQILRAWHLYDGLQVRERYIATAATTGVSVATVISVMRAAAKGH
jgi:hypothetical protein